MNDTTKFTIISISDMLGIAVKREIKLTRQVGDNWAYVVKGKDKEYFLKLGHDVMIFEGWRIAELQLDNETSWLGPKNSINFLTNNRAALETFLIRNQKNNNFNAWDKIRYQLVSNRSNIWLDLFKNVAV